MLFTKAWPIWGLGFSKWTLKFIEAVWASPQSEVCPPRHGLGSSHFESGCCVDIVTLPSQPSWTVVSVFPSARHCPEFPSKCLASYCLFYRCFGYCLDVEFELGAGNRAGNPSNLCRPCSNPLLLWPVRKYQPSKERIFIFLHDFSRYSRE